jgi:hypothetical protein
MNSQGGVFPRATGNGSVLSCLAFSFYFDSFDSSSDLTSGSDAQQGLWTLSLGKGDRGGFEFLTFFDF